MTVTKIDDDTVEKTTTSQIKKSRLLLIKQQLIEKGNAIKDKLVEVNEMLAVFDE